MPIVENPDLSEVDYWHRPNVQVRLGAYERDYTIMDMLENGTYHLGEQYMGIVDPVWGECKIGDGTYDPMLIELARTPLFRRAQAIEQLTLGPKHATMPNAMYFSRWQHIWGSLVFVRKMTEGDARFSERDSMVMQLRTLLSDVGHTAFSHLGDWMFQGAQGSEDLHDRELKNLLKISGISDILNKYGFSLEETVFPDVSDWVECSSPDLCVDRVDYGLREIIRWGNSFLPFHEYKHLLKESQSLFEIDEEQKLVVRDKRFAQIFAAGYGILPTEHWNHPIQNTQLYLLENAVKGIIVSDMDDGFSHPRDLMYGIDADFEYYFKTWDNVHFGKLLEDIALSQRFIFQSARVNDLNRVFGQPYGEDEWKFPDFPDPMTSYSWQSETLGGPHASQVEVEKAEVQEYVLQVVDKGIEIHLPHKKPRSIDPLVAHNGHSVRLSELDESYGNYLDGQKRAITTSYIATILVRSAVADKIAERYNKVEEEWAYLLRRKRSQENLSRIVRESMYLAAARSFDAIHEVDDDFFDEAYR
ncbi:hypothetical protein KBC77_00520 [Candidatus Saccharibacteria bacterium]|nr:hypothetical protein [Candidatus Saccharibacteria bacterium]